jgi:hypothetical protein
MRNSKTRNVKKPNIKTNSGGYFVYEFEIDKDESYDFNKMLEHIRNDYLAKKQTNELQMAKMKAFEVQFTVEFIIYFLWLLSQKIDKLKFNSDGIAKLKLDKIEIGFIHVFVSPYPQKGEFNLLEQIFKCSTWKSETPFLKQATLLLQEKN